MDGDQGALNKFESGQWSAGFNDILVSAENLLGRVETDAEKAAAVALKTFVSQFATPFGQQALGLAATAATDVLQGQSVPQIAATIAPQITADAVTDAEKAGQVTLDAVRVALSGATPNSSSSTATTETPPASPPAAG
jgi:hypothetical protein